MNRNEIIEKKLKIHLEQDYIDTKGNYWREGIYDPREISDSVILHAKNKYKLIEDQLEEKKEKVETTKPVVKEDIIKVTAEIKSRKKPATPKAEFQNLTPKKDETIRVEKQ